MSQLFHDPGNYPGAAGGRKVCLATTAYDSPDASYTFSIQKTREALHAEGIRTEYMLLSGNCHVDDARNRIVQEFLLGDSDELVFLDADVSWEPEALIELCKFDADIVGGVYPYRREGGTVQDNMPVRMLPGIVDPDEDGLLEVEGLPAGFMRIKREVLETLERSANKFWNRGDRRSKIPIIFERTFDQSIRWGGDLHMCNLWRAEGGKVHAAYELHLGHVTKTIVRDSLGAALRRQGGETLAYLVNRLRAGVQTEALFREARRYANNEWGATEDVLYLCAVMARNATGPIIEAGSGLTTIILAAASPPDVPVYCLEHDEVWAARMGQMIAEAGVGKVGLCFAPIVDGWYDLSGYPDLPDHFSLGLNDGPPRALGDRMGFYKHFGDKTDTIIIDDADDRTYGDALEEWAEDRSRVVNFFEDRAALIRQEEPTQSAA